jgi:hypothetical protein
MRRILPSALLLAGASLGSGSANAVDPCPTLRMQTASTDTATRIAAVACNENLLWYRPFIDTDGRMAGATVAEGENSLLGDGVTPAWQRVAGYWRDSGLLPRMAGYAGAGQCALGIATGDASPWCRAFIIDHPWSAAFVSYVMAKAGVPGFRPSAAHFDYVRDARRSPASSAYLYQDPAVAVPAAGDLLCAVRGGQPRGNAGLSAAIDAGAGAINMHCDVVIAVEQGGGTAYLVGGNVQQGVTLRLLSVNRLGRFWALPQSSGADPKCSPDSAKSCNLNRQDWAVLLKLKPAAALAQLPRFVAPVAATIVAPTRAPQCCVNCVLGEPIPRCPIPEATSP